MLAGTGRRGEIRPGFRRAPVACCAVVEAEGMAQGYVPSTRMRGEQPGSQYVHMAFWFCLKHMAVEPDEGCAHADRLGPYEEHADAAAALEGARKRSQAWDTDPKWND